MPTITDPAREFADLCQALTHSPKGRGDEHLAHHFKVRSWSAEFFQIIFCILSRADLVCELVKGSRLDDDYKGEMIAKIQEIKGAFEQTSLNNAWSSVGAGHLIPQNILLIKAISSEVRQSISYPKLDDKEIEQILAEVAQLETWLNEHQLVEQDFIRQAILDGLKQFKFRLERIGWFGWGYTSASLRDVIGAYFALERATPNDDSAPVAEALLQRVRSFVKNVYETASTAKDVAETGDFLLRVYAAYSIVKDSGIAGLLTGK